MADLLLPAGIVLTEAALRAWGLSRFLRTLRLPAVAATGRVTLILPLTGPVPGLEALFAALAAQTLVPARLIVAVESDSDPAAARARALARMLPCPLEIVIAGTAERCGQKNANLVAALARITAGDQAVVMLDADIQPQPWWLSALATPVLEGEHDLVTGYRWPLPGGAGAMATLWAALDRGFAMIPKPDSMGFAWGGSLALSPAALAGMDLPRRLSLTLSDDLVIGAAAAERGLRQLRRRALLLPTPAEAGVLAFARRQAQIMRVYRPGWWTLGALGTLVSLGGWTALALAAADGSVLAAAILAFGMAAGLARWPAQRRVGATIGAPPDPPGTAAALAAIAALPPLVGAFGALLYLASAVPRRIRWRHVDYALGGPEEVRVVARRTPDDA